MKNPEMLYRTGSIVYLKSDTNRTIPCTVIELHGSELRFVYISNGVITKESLPYCVFITLDELMVADKKLSDLELQVMINQHNQYSR